MGTIQQGRQGAVGFAFQSAEGTANATPDVYLPFNSNTLQNRHEPIPVTHSVASRRMNESSVQGKKWSEGELGVILDTVNSGYPIKLFMGNELLDTGTPNSHTFYTTVSGNTPKFATLIYKYGDTVTEQFSDVAANTLSLNIGDGLGELNVALMGNASTDASDITPTTTSGTPLSFTNYSLQFGATLAAAASANPTPVEEFTLEATNNIEMIFSSQSTAGTNSNNPRKKRLGNLEYTGTYKLFFDSVTERDAYMTSIKRALRVRFTIGSLETFTINISKFRLNEYEIDTGIDNLYAISGSFTGETDRTQVPNDFNIIIQNSKGTVY